MHSIITIKFRGTGVYQNAYWCEQGNREPCQCEQWCIKFSLNNPFHATDLFWYPLKTSENLWFSDVFRRYQKRSVAWNGLSSPDTILRTYRFLQLLFLQILPKIAKNYVAKRIDFLRSRKNYHHNNFKFQKCTKSQKTDLAKLQFYRKKSY